MTALVWTGIACAAVLAAVGLWAWLWRTPRVWPQFREVGCEHMAMAVTAAEARKKEWRCTHGCVMTEGYIAYDRDVDHALEVVAEHCCDLHNRNCEPPSELCCWECTEAEHPLHRTTDCIAPDLSAGFDVIAEPDRRRAEHMNRTLRRAEGGDET